MDANHERKRSVASGLGGGDELFPRVAAAFASPWWHLSRQGRAGDA